MDVIYPLALLPPQRNVQHRLSPLQDCCIKYPSKTAYDMKPRRAVPPLPSQQEENVPEKAQDGLQKSIPMNETATAHPLRNIGIATGKGARERRQPEKKQEQIASQRCGGIPTVPYSNSIAKPRNSIQQQDRESEPELSLEQIQESQPSSSIEQRIEGGYIQQFREESHQHVEKKIQKTDRQKQQQQHFEKRTIHEQTDKQQHQMNHIEQYTRLHSQKMEEMRSLVQNLQNQINTLHSDLRHLVKRCKFYERKSAGHEKRQRKVERILAMQRKKKGEKLVSGKERVNDDDEAEDEHYDNSLDADDGNDEDVYKDAENSHFWIDHVNENENKEETDANEENDNEIIHRSASGFKRERTSKTDAQKKRVRRSQTSNKSKMDDDKQFSIVPHNALDFNIMFRRLQAFHCEYGTCNVPKEYEDSQLRRWTSTWRATKSRRYNRVLETAGGPEVVFAGLENGVIASIALFRADRSKNNASQGGCANNHDGLELSEIGLPLYSQAWEEEQVKHIESRAEERRHRFLLQTRYQMECLDTLDFEWCLSKAVPFEERLEQMAKFIAENGHCDVHRSHEELGEFFHRMKRECIEGKKWFLEKQHPRLLEIGVDMFEIVRHIKRRRRRKNVDTKSENKENGHDGDDRPTEEALESAGENKN